MKRLPVVALPVLSAVALLAGCANPAADKAIEAKYAMIGMHASDLLGCAGVPDRKAENDGNTYYTYVARRTEARAAPAYGVWGYSGGWGLGSSMPVYTQDVATQTCQVTFTLRHDEVKQVIYGGDATDGRRPDACYPIVGNCLDIARRLRGLE